MREGVGGLPAGPLAPGTVLGKYRIVRLLGEGGMGSVYEGLHLEIGKRVAIKTISAALATVPEARARFLLEAQLTSRVRHPHTVDVTDICLDNEPAFLVMEYLEGEDLARHLRRVGPMALAEVVDIALPILTAVAAAHDEGVVHRDLKPQNIFLAWMRDGTMQPKILDFGISKAPAYSPIRTSGAILGSPSYFAPEQVVDPKAISPASDQYALGVILYECVTGRLPYDGSNLAAIFQSIVTGGYQAPRAYRTDLPADFEAVITRAMSLVPTDRFPDLRQMGRALLPFATPRTQLLWRDQFSDAPAATAVRGSEGSSPVPVTDQTPRPVLSPLSITAAMPGTRRPSGAAEPVGPARWILPVRSPHSSDPLLEVPRRFHLSRWVLGAGGLAAAALLVAVIASRGHPRMPAPSDRSPASAPEPALHAQTAPGGAGTDTADKPRPEATEHPARQARAAHRPRLGTNKSPLIE